VFTHSRGPDALVFVCLVVRLRSDFVRWSFRLYLAPGYGSSPSC
jgi:hypothetical protein